MLIAELPIPGMGNLAECLLCHRRGDGRGLDAWSYPRRAELIGPARVNRRGPANGMLVLGAGPPQVFREMR